MAPDFKQSPVKPVFHASLPMFSSSAAPAIAAAVNLRIHVECAARLYGNPREADLIKIHLHARKLTFHYDRRTSPSPAGGSPVQKTKILTP